MALSGRHDLPRTPAQADWGRGSKYDIDNPNLSQLMWQTGYLTWCGGADQPSVLDFPNREVRETYAQDLLGAARANRSLGLELIQQMREALRAEDMDTFASRLNTYHQGIVCENLDRESPCRAVLQALCGLMSDNTTAEKHTLSGRADHVLVFPHIVYVIEVKYGQGVDAALAQLLDRQYGREFSHGNRKVMGLGVNFDPDARNRGDLFIRLEPSVLYNPLDGTEPGAYPLSPCRGVLTARPHPHRKETCLAKMQHGQEMSGATAAAQSASTGRRSSRTESGPLPTSSSHHSRPWGT